MLIPFGSIGVVPALLLVFIPLPTLRLVGSILDLLGVSQLATFALLVRLLRRFFVFM